MRKTSVFVMILVAGWGCRGSAETVTLKDYLQQIRIRHPFFRQEALSYEIALKQQERFLGGEDWRVRLTPSYAYDDTTEVGFARPDKIDNARLAAGVERKVWKTGGQLDLSYDHDYLDQVLNNSTVELPGGPTWTCPPARRGEPPPAPFSVPATRASFVPGAATGPVG